MNKEAYRLREQLADVIFSAIQKLLREEFAIYVRDDDRAATQLMDAIRNYVP